MINADFQLQSRWKNKIAHFSLPRSSFPSGKFFAKKKKERKSEACGGHYIRSACASLPGNSREHLLLGSSDCEEERQLERTVPQIVAEEVRDKDKWLPCFFPRRAKGSRLPHGKRQRPTEAWILTLFVQAQICFAGSSFRSADCFT
jgi:hypothetical protein